MKEKWMLLGLILVILSTGCVEEMLDQVIGTGEEMACDTVDPSTVNPDWDRSHCYKDAAERKKTPETCAKIEDSAPKTKCYMELGIELGRGDLCNYLQNNPPSMSGEYSRLECLHKVAVKTANPLLCEDMYGEYQPFIGSAYNIENCHKAVEEEKSRRQRQQEEEKLGPGEPGDTAFAGSDA